MSNIELDSLKTFKQIPAFIDFDEYDNQVFQSGKTNKYCSLAYPSIFTTIFILHSSFVGLDSVDSAYQIDVFSNCDDGFTKRRLSEVSSIRNHSKYQSITPPNSPSGHQVKENNFDRWKSQLSSSVDNTHFIGIN